MTPSTQRAGADLRLLRAAVFTAACVVLSAAGHTLASGASVPLWTLGAGVALVFVAVAPLAGRERSLPGIALGLAAGQLALHTLFAGGQSGSRHGAGARSSSTAGGSTTDGTAGVLGLARRLVCGDSGTPLTEAEAQRIVAEAGLTAPSGPAAGSLDAGHGSSPGAQSLPGAHSSHSDGGVFGDGIGHLPADLAAGLLPGDSVSCLQQAVRAAISVLAAPMLLSHLLSALALGWLLRRGEVAVWRLVRLGADVAEVTAQTLRLRALRSVLRFVLALLAGLLPQLAPLDRHRERERTAGPEPSAVLLHSVVRRGPPRASGDLTLAA